MIHLEISISGRKGNYLITPEGNRPDGSVFLKVMLVTGRDEHDHPTGPAQFIDVEELFADEPA